MAKTKEILILTAAVFVLNPAYANQPFKGDAQHSVVVCPLADLSVRFKMKTNASPVLLQVRKANDSILGQSLKPDFALTLYEDCHASSHKGAQEVVHIESFAPGSVKRGSEEKIVADALSSSYPFDFSSRKLKPSDFALRSGLLPEYVQQVAQYYCFADPVGHESFLWCRGDRTFVILKAHRIDLAGKADFKSYIELEVQANSPKASVPTVNLKDPRYADFKY